jgi:ubiquinone/menaquinone biosynthesis C-methylase UbiE
MVDSQRSIPETSMNDFEKEYYEADIFWEGEALQDENNLTRVKETAALIPEDANSLLDVGCGNGVFVNYLQQLLPGLKLLAIDRSHAALKYVKTEKREGDIADIPLADRSYDCVTCLEVIEHLPIGVFQRALSELTRVAKQYVIVSVPYAEELERNHTQCPECKSIFNADLHLRTFSEKKIDHLLEKYNFQCVATKKAGKQASFKGHYFFTRIFYPEQFRSWRSPICPICGYRVSAANASSTTDDHAVATSAIRPRSVISYFTGVPKLFWPKETKYYWIIGLYRRK